MDVRDEQFKWTNILITKPVYHIHTLQVTENVYGKRLEENEVEWKKQVCRMKKDIRR